MVTLVWVYPEFQTYLFVTISFLCPIKFFCHIKTSSFLTKFFISADGDWSEWSDWDTCTQTCEGGNQTRTRTCTNPSPANGGNDCGPDDTEMQNCNEGPCAIGN